MIIAARFGDGGPTTPSAVGFFSFRAVASSAFASLSCCIYTENRGLKDDKNDMSYHQNFACYVHFDALSLQLLF
jgi:hypothetical protein